MRFLTHFSASRWTPSVKSRRVPPVCVLTPTFVALFGRGDLTVLRVWWRCQAAHVHVWLLEVSPVQVYFIVRGTRAQAPFCP